MLKKNNSLTRSMIFVSMASTLTLLFSFLKETVTANYFGTSAQADAYTIAVQLPVVLFSTVSMAVSNVVIPIYSKKYVQESEKNANNYVSNLISILIFIAIFFTGFSILFANIILKITAPGLPQKQIPLAVFIFRMIVPTIILTIVIKVNNGVMNFHNEFTKPVLIINFLNIPFSLIVIIFSKKYGIMSAVFGILVGTILEFMTSCAIRRKYMKYKFIFDLQDKTVKESVLMSVPVLIGIGVDEVGKVFDKMIASMLETGSISSLNYASRLSTGISSLLLTGISTVSYPEYTKSVAKGNEKNVSRVFLYSIQLYFIIILPVIVGGSFLSKEIIMLVFCRGEFGMSSVISTAPLFCWYLVCLFFSSIRNTFSNLFYAYGDTKTPMINSSIGIIINIILNFLLSIKFGAQGIAAATAISTAIVCIILMMRVKKKNDCISYIPIFRMLKKVLIGILIMVSGLILIKHLFVSKNLYNLNNIYSNSLLIILSIILSIIIYFSTLIILKCEVIEDISNKILDVIKKK